MRKKRKFLSEEEIHQVIDMYQSKMMTTNKIGGILGVSYNYIRNILIRNNIKLRGPQDRYLRADYDTSFFEKINSEGKAYFLGLLYADGYNGNYCFRLGLQIQDGYLVRKFQKLLKTTGKLYKQKAKNSRCQPELRLGINCVKMAQDLAKLGCVTKKSLILDFPSFDIVPENLFHHFIRGFFDGDGCFHLKKELHGQCGVSGLNIVSSTLFCEKWIKFFADKNMTFSIQRRKTKCGKLEYATVFSNNYKSTLNFCEYIYKDATILMKRKYLKYKGFLKYLKDKNKRKKYNFMGVHDGYNGKYKVSITENGKTYRLGYYADPITAAKARDKELYRIRGEFGMFNFPDEIHEIIKQDFPQVQRIKNRFGYFGVSKNSKNSFRAFIIKDGKRIGLGCYLTAKDAALMYDKKSWEFYKDKWKLNFPDLIEETLKLDIKPNKFSFQKKTYKK